jgi:hypothetical protein
MQNGMIDCNENKKNAEIILHFEFYIFNLFNASEQ